MNSEEVAVATLLCTGSFSFPILLKKTLDFWKKSQAFNTQVQYTFDVAKTTEIFDFLLKEKFITFPQDHQLPNKEELREKYTVSITTPRSIVLILVGVSGILSKTGSTREYRSSLRKKKS